MHGFYFFKIESWVGGQTKKAQLKYAAPSKYKAMKNILLSGRLINSKTY
jgi:hypothetical protein